MCYVKLSSTVLKKSLHCTRDVVYYNPCIKQYYDEAPSYVQRNISQDIFNEACTMGKHCVIFNRQIDELMQHIFLSL